MLRTQPDGRLVALAREGDTPAFEELVRRHRAGLVAFAGRIASASRADDVVQDSTIKAHTALTRGDEVDHPRAWLYGIVRNTSLNHLRAEHHHEQLDDAIDGVEQPPQAFERREELAELVSAMDELPATQRAAIVQRELEGRGHEEIAGTLGVSTGAVRQLIYRARHTLRAGAAALIPAQLLRAIALSAGADPVSTGAGGAAGAGAGFTAAKLGLGAMLATGAIVGGAEVGGEVDSHGGGSTAVAADVARAGTQPGKSSTAARRSSEKRQTAPRRKAAAGDHYTAHHAHVGHPPPPPSQNHAAPRQDSHAPPPGGGNGGGYDRHGGGYEGGSQQQPPTQQQGGSSQGADAQQGTQGAPPPPSA